MGEQDPSVALLDATPIVDYRRRLPQHSVGRWPRRNLDDIKGVVVHHTAGNRPPEAEAVDHIAKGWPGLGYTIWIEPTGEVLWLNDFRALTFSQKGKPPVPWLTKSNTHFMSVVLRGNLTSAPASHAQAAAFRWLWCWLRATLDLGDDMLFGHREFKSTICPGEGGMALVEEFVGNVLPVRKVMPANVLDAQRVLARLGHTLGPSGLDGVWGPASAKALRSATGHERMSFDSAYALAYRLATSGLDINVG